MKFENIKTIKEYILNNTTEETIFSYYLNVPISDIIDSINNKSFKIKNKHRFEKNPSITFTNHNRLRMVDYGSREWTGDCFHIVGKVLRKNCNDSKEFMYILNDIITNVIKQNTQYIGIDIPVTTKKVELTKIDILIRDFNKLDYDYFFQFGIKKESLINTFAIENYWINDILNVYEYKKNNPCYCYYLGKIDNTILWKLYFPYKTENRFITNNKLCIENINEIKGNKILLLTKSQKDKILLRQIFKDLNIRIIDVFSTNSEAIHISESIINYLKSKYNIIVSMFDNDKAGINGTEYLINTYKIYPFFLIGCKAILSKDISDSVKDYGYKKILDLIKQGYIDLING